jgi:hypothetical protein
MAGYAVMSWHWFVIEVRWVPGPWSPPVQSPAIAPVSMSAKTRGSFTTRACCGAFSGTWMTAMLQYEDSGSSGDRSGEHPASSSPARATLVPET